ncbi:MAG: NrfD/PsrC family molybdoenzyme membrane anchor subunit [Desulforhopalus sp.]
MIFLDNVASPDVPDRHLFPLFIILSCVAVIGLSFGLHAMIVGHDHVFGTSREVPWGILITPYVFFACMATGLCIISSLGQIFRIKIFEPLVTRTVFLAIITMLAGLTTIGLEVENPWRVMIYGIFTANPLSNIWWKSALYTQFLLFMIFNFLFLLVDKTRIARVFAVVALIAITSGNLNMNSDMALLGARGFWAENYMPLFFLIISTLLGCCILTLQIFFSNRLLNKTMDPETGNSLSAVCRLTALLLICTVPFCAMKMLGGFSEKFTENPLAMQLLVRGDFALNFWVGEIILAVLLPLFLLFLGRRKKLNLLYPLACLSSVVGIFITFYDLIIVGQLIPHYHEYHLYGYPELYSYTPHLHEYMMTLGIFFFFFATAILGEMIFNSVRLRESSS